MMRESGFEVPVDEATHEVFNDDYKQLPLPLVAQRARQSVKWITGRVARRSLPRSLSLRRQA